MGCWNATCGLTGLPITCDEPVIAMVVERNDKQDFTPCYPWHNWSPRSMVVRGLYDDYGGVELSEGEKAKLGVASEWTQNGFIYESDDNSRYSLSRQADDKLGLWMAHENVFVDLIESVTISTYAEKFKSLPIIQVVENQLRRNQDSDRNSKDQLFRDNPWSSDASAFRGTAANMVTRRLFRGVKEDVYDKYCGYWTDLTALYHIMDSLRITLSPLGGAGSQDCNYDDHKAKCAAIERQISRSDRDM